MILSNLTRFKEKNANFILVDVVYIYTRAYNYTFIFSKSQLFCYLLE